jgi:ABC-type phosphate/phosphonate transport system permease subunit
MRVKILKSSGDFWYNKFINTYVNIDKFIPAYSPNNIKDVLVIYLSELGEYGDIYAQYIYAQDTNYYKQIRKQKLEILKCI